VEEGTVKSKLFWAAKLNHTSGLKHLKSLIDQKLIKEIPQEEVVSSSRDMLYAITERGTKALEIYHILISETTTSCYSDRNIATSMS
jgi:predicted transcriptional regulator